LNKGEGKSKSCQPNIILPFAFAHFVFLEGFREQVAMFSQIFSQENKRSLFTQQPNPTA
jgi:hypothetical protein